MDITVTFELGQSFADFMEKLSDLVTERSAELTALLTPLPATPVAPVQPVQPAQPAQPEAPAASDLPFQTEEPAAEPQAPAPVAPAKKYTAADVRDAMHRCRLRIEGDDYDTNPDSEGRKLYHKALNTKFKRIAESLGYDKPTLLPAELIDGFIAQTECIVVENGEVTDKAPF